ncbi:MAG: hypothetical protein WC527_02505 [Candidatus Margulisiibacteriota bacterium]
MIGQMLCRMVDAIHSGKYAAFRAEQRTDFLRPIERKQKIIDVATRFGAQLSEIRNTGEYLYLNSSSGKEFAASQKILHEIQAKAVFSLKDEGMQLFPGIELLWGPIFDTEYFGAGAKLRSDNSGEGGEIYYEITPEDCVAVYKWGLGFLGIRNGRTVMFESPEPWQHFYFNHATQKNLNIIHEFQDLLSAVLEIAHERKSRLTDQLQAMIDLSVIREAVIQELFKGERILKGERK